MKTELTVNNNNNKVIISHVAFIKLVKLGCWFNSDTLAWDIMDAVNMKMWESGWYKRQWKITHGN